MCGFCFGSVVVCVLEWLSDEGWYSYVFVLLGLVMNEKGMDNELCRV